MSLAPEKTDFFFHVYIQQLSFIEGASLFVCVFICVSTSISFCLRKILFVVG